jgi:hypothetical protein
VPERAQEPDRTADPVRLPPGARAAAPPAATAAHALARRVGNRGMGRVLARLEAGEAVETLAQSLSTGVVGAERRVVDTMTALRADPAGLEQVAKDYERKVERPLDADLARVPDAGGTQAG